MNNLIEHNLFCGCQKELRPPEIFRMPGIYVISKVEVTRLRLPLRIHYRDNIINEETIDLVN